MSRRPRLLPRGRLLGALGLVLVLAGELDAVPTLVALGAGLLALLVVSALARPRSLAGLRPGGLAASPLPGVGLVDQPLPLAWQDPSGLALRGAGRLGTLAADDPLAAPRSGRRPPLVPLVVGPAGQLAPAFPDPPRPAHRGILALPAASVYLLDALGLWAWPVGRLEPTHLPVLPPPIAGTHQLLAPPTPGGPPEPPPEPGLVRTDRVASPARVHWPASLRSGTLLLRSGPPAPGPRPKAVVDLAQLAQATWVAPGSPARGDPADPGALVVALAAGLVLQHLQAARSVELSAPATPPLVLETADPAAFLRAAHWLATAPPRPRAVPLAP
jgi:hypothetical protein